MANKEEAQNRFSSFFDSYENYEQMTGENNNPKDEKINPNPEYFPLSDSDNTREWVFSETMSDEFEADELDTEKWFDMHQYWNGREPSYFKTKNVRQEDGKLVINSDWGEVVDGVQTFEAACVHSKTLSGYGYYEIKARVAPISMTSSFWLQGKYIEIDVFEQIGRAKKDHECDEFPTNSHNFVNGWENDITAPFSYKTGCDLAADYHVYGFEWGKDYLKYYFDGKLIHALKNEGFHDSMTVFFDMESFVWNGYPNEEDFCKDENGRFSGDYHIEYLRVWRTKTPQTDEMPEVQAIIPKELKAIKYTPKNIENGVVDEVWENARKIANFSIVSGGIEKLKANIQVKALWDFDGMYVLVNVDDDDIFVNKTDKWNGDCVDLYIDFDNTKAEGGYTDRAFSIKLMPDGEGHETSKNAPANITYGRVETQTGYILQCNIPWGDFKADSGKKVGFDVQLNEGTNEAKERVAVIVWSDKTGKLCNSMRTVGNLILALK